MTGQGKVKIVPQGLLEVTKTVKRYRGTPLYGHPYITDSFVCPDGELTYFL